MKALLFCAVALLFSLPALAQEAPCNPDVEDCYLDDGAGSDPFDYYDDDPFYDDSFGYDEPWFEPDWGYGTNFSRWNYKSLFHYVFSDQCWDDGTGCHDIVDFQFGDTDFWGTQVRGHLIATKFLKLYDTSWFFGSYSQFTRSAGANGIFEGTVGIPIYPIYEKETFVCTKYSSGETPECPAPGDDDPFGDEPIGGDPVSDDPFSDEPSGDDPFDDEPGDDPFSEASSNSLSADSDCPSTPAVSECIDGHYNRTITKSYKAIDFMVFYVRVKFPQAAALRAGEFERIGVEWKNGTLFLSITDPWYSYSAPTIFALPTQFLGMRSELHNPFRMLKPMDSIVEFDVTAGDRTMKAPPIAALVKEAFQKTTADANGHLVLTIKDAGYLAAEKTSYPVELFIQNANDGFGQNTFGKGELLCFSGEIAASSNRTEIDFHTLLGQIKEPKCLENGGLRDGKKYFAKLRVKRETPVYTAAASTGVLQTMNLKWSATGEANEGGGVCGSMAGSNAGSALSLLALLLGACLILRRRA